MTATSYPPTGTLSPAAPGTLLLKNVTLYGEGDPTNVLIDNGIITEIGTQLDDADQVVDGHGGVLLPGLVDMHVHLREPGREDTETIATGSAAAAKGGFTAVFTMANTTPVLDQPIIAESVWFKGQNIGLCDVHPVGSITKGLQGKELTEFGMMTKSEARVRMFSDDGKCVDNPLIMRRAIEYAKGLDVLLAQHCEDPRLPKVRWRMRAKLLPDWALGDGRVSQKNLLLHAMRFYAATMATECIFVMLQPRELWN